MEECRLVARAADALAIPCAILRREAEPPRSRVQERARAARYALLLAHAEAIGATHLLTAHTLDDQAETILFRMARGSGIDGLAGMRARVRRGCIWLDRPLLGIAKARLLATCTDRGIVSVTDPSNADPRFARVRHRALLPLLAAEGLDAARFALLAARAERASEALEQRARDVFRKATLEESKALTLDATLLCAEPAEIVLRCLRLAIAQTRDDIEITSEIDEVSPLRLNRIEALSRRLQAAAGWGHDPYAATLGGLSFRLDVQGRLRIAAAPPRR